MINEFGTKLAHKCWLTYNYFNCKWKSTPVLLPGKSHGQRSQVGYSPWGRKESDTTEWLHFHFGKTMESLQRKMCACTHTPPTYKHTLNTYPNFTYNFQGSRTSKHGGYLSSFLFETKALCAKSLQSCLILTAAHQAPLSMGFSRQEH